MAAFEGEHLLPCFRQVGGIDEAVVAAADDDYIVMLCHAERLRSDFASRAERRQIVHSKLREAKTGHSTGHRECEQGSSVAASCKSRRFRFETVDFKMELSECNFGKVWES